MRHLGIHIKTKPGTAELRNTINATITPAGGFLGVMGVYTQYIIYNINDTNDTNSNDTLYRMNRPGKICLLEIPECASQPCLNGGMCQEGLNGYQCACSDGYTGVHCEEDIDECSSVPCANGASCSDGVGSYSCLCRDGYQGIERIISSYCLIMIIPS